MTPEELLESLEGMTFRHASDVEEEIAELTDFLDDSLSFLPPEEVAAMEAAGRYYADAKSEAEYVLEGGDPRSAISSLTDYHPGVSIDRDELADHPSTVIAQALSDDMNASRISHRRDPVVRAPKSFY